MRRGKLVIEMGKRDGRWVHLSGPRYVTEGTANEIIAELEAQRLLTWKRIRVEPHRYENDGSDLWADIEIDSSADEQTVEMNLQALEAAASSRVPTKIPIWRNEPSWMVGVSTVENGVRRVLETSISGHERQPDRKVNPGAPSDSLSSRADEVVCLSLREI